MIYNGIKYRLTTEGAVIVKNVKKNQTTIEIPEVFDKKPVIGIDELAFAESMQLERIILPPTIKNIGDYAFYDCRRLRDVVFSGACKELYIGEGSFSSCESLKNINMPVTLTKPYAFRNCKGLEEIAVCEHIPHDTFLWCINLQNVHWYGMKNYGTIAKTDEAFVNCNNLKRLYIYSDFAEIHKEDLKKLENAIIYCEETCSAAELAYEGYRIVFIDNSLPF